MVSMKKGLLLGTIMLVFINTRHNSDVSVEEIMVACLLKEDMRSICPACTMSKNVTEPRPEYVVFTHSAN